MIKFLSNLVPNEYALIAKIIAATVFLGVIVAALMSAYTWAYDNGVTDEKLAWQQSQNLSLQDALTNLKIAEEKNRLAEQAHAAALNQASQNYQKGLNDEKKKRDDVIASYRAGTLSLRDKYATNNAGNCEAVSAKTSTSDGGRDATQGAKLSEPLSQFLIGLTSEADEVVQQLTACQVELVATHKACETLQ